MTTEELFLYLLDQKLAEPKRLCASITRSGKGQPLPHSPGVLEASLYVVYESSIFVHSPVGSAEIMAVQFPWSQRGQEDRVRRMLDDALWSARVDHGSDESPADLSAAVMESAEVNAFRLLLELPSVCLRLHASVLDAAKASGLIDFAVPDMTPKESATLPANSTGLTQQVLERLASAAPAVERAHWGQSMDASPGMV